MTNVPMNDSAHKVPCNMSQLMFQSGNSLFAFATSAHKLQGTVKEMSEW